LYIANNELEADVAEKIKQIYIERNETDRTIKAICQRETMV
jgi:hypothetical protein